MHQMHACRAQAYNIHVQNVLMTQLHTLQSKNRLDLKDICTLTLHLSVGVEYRQQIKNKIKLFIFFSIGIFITIIWILYMHSNEYKQA